MAIKIIGTGSKLPSRLVSNQQLSTFLDTSDEWITSKTGIKTRAILTETITTMAAQAAEAAISNSGLKDGDIDMIICSTISPDYITPSMACAVAQQLNLTCPAFDINAACTGFIYALDTAHAFISSGKVNNILIIAAENMSRLVDWQDRASCVLFGDGAAACVVTGGESLKYIRLSCEPQVAPLYMKFPNGNSPFDDEKNTPTYLQMEGPQVYKFAVKTIEKEILCALSSLNMAASDVDYFILHQANERIIEGARTRLKLPAEKFPMNISKYGNMSAASIPVLLHEMVADGRIKAGTLCMMIGFGAGMTAGTAVMTW